VADSPGRSARGPRHGNTRTPQQIGASNRRAGKQWQLNTAAWLRDSGHFPNAEYVIRNGAGDISGTWDISVETTVTTWDKIWIKLDQAKRDAEAKGLRDYVVWKKRTGTADPGDGAVIMPAARFWALIADLEAYVRADMDYTETWEKAFTAGFRAGATTRGNDDTKATPIS
jgi:hypothetical protein